MQYICNFKESICTLQNAIGLQCGKFPANKKCPEYKNSGHNCTNTSRIFFSHPDYTVGTGISPVQPFTWVADYTAGGESHPAPKNPY